MTVPTISNLPTVPATSDPNFETEAPALFNHIKNTFVSEMNSAISFINSSTFDATVEFKNANFTAARNFLYMIDTSSGGVSVTLPANPSTGDQLLLMDQKRTFGTNNLTIGRNSQNINGAASDVVSKSTGALIRCIFQASYGWTVDLYEGQWESGYTAGDLVYTGGNVGIGTTAPSTTSNLEIMDSVNPTIRMNRDDSTLGDGDIIGTFEFNQKDPSTPGAGVVGKIQSINESSSIGKAGLSFSTGDQSTIEERVRIDSQGNVGIGETSPSSKLDIGLTSSFNKISGKYINYRQVGDGTNEGYLLLIPAHTTGTSGAKRFNGTIVADRGSTINGNESMRARINVFAAYTNNQGMLELFGNADHYFSKLVIVTFSGVDYIAAYFEQTGGGPANGIFVEDAIVAGLDSNCLTIKYGSEINAVVNSNFGSITSNILGKVGIGTSAPNQKLDIITGETQSSCFHIGERVNEGAYFSSTTDNALQIWAGAQLDSNAIRARATAASGMTLNNGLVVFYTDDTLTDGATYTQSERMRIDTDGNVGIGTSSPGAELHVKSSAFGDIYQVQLEDGSGNVGLKLGQYGTVGEISGLSGLEFEVNEIRKLKIDSAGNVEVSTGNLVIGTAGKGIDFGVASSPVTSQLLDDYEEGTWSPVVADASSGGNTASGSFSGTYTKIGRVVTVHCYALNINTTGMTSTNSLVIRNLPFQNVGLIAKYGSVRLDSVTFSGYCTAQIGGSASHVSIIENKNGLGNSGLTVGDLNSGVSDIYFGLTYETS